VFQKYKTPRSYSGAYVFSFPSWNNNMVGIIQAATAPVNENQIFLGSWTRAGRRVAGNVDNPASFLVFPEMPPCGRLACSGWPPRASGKESGGSERSPYDA
jgi:hypothetical protein